MTKQMSVTWIAGIGAWIVLGLASRPFASFQHPETTEAPAASMPGSIPTEFEVDTGPAKSILQGGAGTNIRVFLLCQGSAGNLELTTGSEKRTIGSPELMATYVDLGAGTTLTGHVTGTGGKFTVKIVGLSSR